jgi:ribosomal protein L5
MSTALRPRLKVRFDEEIRQALKEELGLDNIMQVPPSQKIVLNSGVGTRDPAGLAARRVPSATSRRSPAKSRS